MPEAGFPDDDPVDFDDGDIDVADYNGDDEEPFDDDEPFDFNQFADKRVRVKVGGEETEVTLQEAIAGYQRQADYTRKTQELAQERQQLAAFEALKQSLEQDPEGTLRILSGHYGVQLGEPQRGQRKVEPEFDFDDEFGDDEPWEPQPRATRAAVDPRIEQMEARLRRFEQQEQQKLIEGQIARLQAQYDDFDPQTVIATALKLGTPDLEAAYKAGAYDRLLAKQREDAQTRERKRQARGVSGGDVAGARGREEAGPIRSIEDAFLAAKRELGIN